MIDLNIITKGVFYSEDARVENIEENEHLRVIIHTIRTLILTNTNNCSMEIVKIKVIDSLRLMKQGN